MSESGFDGAPPEDIGGVPGFDLFLDAMADPQHEEHPGSQRATAGPTEDNGHTVFAGCLQRTLLMKARKI
ncbi:MAG: hypothetical protein RID98_10155 [Roseitalea porphyridii]|uniref:IS1096 element passenger TnpR family protein n=1 Tax=Roseitalea porphyridii TaxID=1852022 RepID=UPI0032EE61B0